MERETLKKFALDEFKKQAPEEIAKDEKRLHEFILKSINEPLLDKLVDEYCQKNPEEFAVLNVLSISDEKLKEITEKTNTAGALERIKYIKIINNAGLAYQGDVLTKLLMT
ncbi:hypothetical protein LQZ19_06285 [Treponema primitia]|uniref:hypothetical protein n=1 Tax=Treponema primitia TaxID=88058 RepID=UPI00397F2B15